MYSNNMYGLGAQPSTIRELFAYGQRRAAEVGADNVFDFSIGNPSIPPPPQIDATIRAILTEQPSLLVHGYTSAGGNDVCREAVVAALNKAHATSYGKQQLFITCGAAPALTAVCKAMSDDDGTGEIIAIAPFFPEYRVFVENTNNRFVAVAADEQQFQIDFVGLEQAITQHTRAVIINSPNNPSGVVYSRQTLLTLAELLTKASARVGHPIYIISDEPYRELVYGGAEAPWIPKLYQDTVVCYSYSKRLSLPGERIGWVLVPPECSDSRELYLSVAGAARSMGHVCAPSLLQQVVARCAELPPELSAYEQNRELLFRELPAYGYRIARPDGAFYLFMQAPKGLSGQEFSQLAKEKYDILMAPGDAFGCPNWLRLSYCVDTDKLKRALPLLKELIDSL